MKDFAKSIVCNTKAEAEKVGNVDHILQGKKESDLKNVVYTVRSNKAPEKKFKSRAEAAKYADSLVEQGHFSVHAQKEFDLGAMRYAIDVNLRAPVAVDNKKVGNFKTGTSQLKPGDRVQSYGVQGTVRKVEGENSDNIYGEPIIEVEWDNGTVKKVGEHYLRKIGNKVGNSKWELPDGSTATVEDDGTIKIKKPRDSSIYITKLWDKERAEKQLAQKGAKKVGNKKLKFTDKKDGLKEFVYDEENDKGYIYYDGKLVDTIPHAGQGWLNLIKQKAFSSGVMNKTGNKVVWKEGPYRIEEVEKDGKFGFYNIPKGSFNAYRNSVLYGNFETLDSAKAKMNEEIRLDKEYNRKYTTNSKTGNAAPDDKFAYVMREFDQGKLKTPDGKVVTDPAQAKAIAYSESKKTENGLARARKAMNKGITMWKGNDSAYIKEDGTVSYLENNSFETDKDKFESQESAIKELSKQGYVKK